MKAVDAVNSEITSLTSLDHYHLGKGRGNGSEGIKLEGEVVGGAEGGEVEEEQVEVKKEEKLKVGTKERIDSDFDRGKRAYRGRIRILGLKDRRLVGTPDHHNYPQRERVGDGGWKMKEGGEEGEEQGGEVLEDKAEKEGDEERINTLWMQ